MKIINDIYTIWLREMIRFVRARSRIVSSLAMPVIWLIFIGVGLGSSFSLPGMNYINFLAPGVVGMIILFTSIFSGVSVIWDRQFGFLKEILVAPVSRTSIVLGKTLGGATVALINGFLMIFISMAFGVIAPSIGIITSIIFMILAAMIFVALGIIIASRMKSMEGFQMVMSFLIMPIFFLSGGIFPIQNTPLWMQAISHIDPLTYAVDGLRGTLVGVNVFPLWIDVTALAAIAAVMITIGSYMFKKSVL